MTVSALGAFFDSNPAAREVIESRRRLRREAEDRRRRRFTRQLLITLLAWAVAAWVTSTTPRKPTTIFVGAARHIHR